MKQKNNSIVYQIKDLRNTIYHTFIPLYILFAFCSLIAMFTDDNTNTIIVVLLACLLNFMLTSICFEKINIEIKKLKNILKIGGEYE